MGIGKEFRDFAVKGNAIDMAVGIIIGASFGRIVTSVVNDLIMPPIGVLLGGVDFKSLSIIVKKAVVDPTTKQVVAPEVAIRYGAFVNTCLDFFIVVLCLFMVVKVINTVRTKVQKAEPKA